MKGIKSQVLNHTSLYSKLDEAYKQPMYYALGHFSKFIPEHSVRVYSSGVRMGPLQTLSVQKPDGSVVLVLLNE